MAFLTLWLKVFILVWWNISFSKILCLLLTFHLYFIIAPFYTLLHFLLFNHYLIIPPCLLYVFVYIFYLLSCPLTWQILFSFTFICILSKGILPTSFICIVIFCVTQSSPVSIFNSFQIFIFSVSFPKHFFLVGREKGIHLYMRIF